MRTLSISSFTLAAFLAASTAATLSARLRGRSGDEDMDGSRSAASEPQAALPPAGPSPNMPPAAGSPDEPAPAVPSRFEQKFEAAHGGRIAMLGGQPFEWVH